jgi:imidazoleglycerol phosphate synthase glutamine amidotransferase subunit HisH
MTDIAIVDYGMGNLHSVSKALEHVAPAASIVVTSNPAEVRKAARVVFPGQGAMPNCMKEMDVRGLRGAVLEAAASKPFLGICIGLQMLFEASEEGNVKGLGIFRCTNQPNIQCGKVLPRMHAFISYTVILLKLLIRSQWQVTVFILLHLLVRWQGIIFLLFSSIRKKVLWQD